MIAMTSVEAQNRFGELIDRSQREPVQVTRRGRPVAYVVSEHDMQALSDLQNEQLIFKVPGKGAFVSRPKPFQQLARLQGFAEAMSGELSPSTTPGGGLTMTLRLPVAGT